MFDHKHYVPILKAKGGEYWALEHLKADSLSTVTPCLELVLSQKKTVSESLAASCKSISKVWKNNYFFVDVRYLGTDSQRASRLDEWVGLAREVVLSYVPVTSLGESQKFQKAISKITKKDRRGVALRLTSRNFTDSDALQIAILNLVKFIGLEPEEVDLLIDYEGGKESDVLAQLSLLNISQLPVLNRWRTLTVAAGAFPDSSPVSQNDLWISISRQEWKFWSSIIKSTSKLARLPAYGDYATRATGLPGRGKPKPNIRYTCPENWLVRRSNAPESEGMISICQSLTGLAEYCGEDFSDGDREFARIVANQDSFGNAQSWTQWSLNHHLEYVVYQIRTLPVL